MGVGERVLYTATVKDALHHCQSASARMSAELTLSCSTCFTSSHDLSVDLKLIESQRDDIRHLLTQSVIDVT